MKKIKFLLIAAIAAFSVQSSKAQLALGGEAGYTIGGGVLSNINLGLRADYGLDATNGIMGGVSFLLPLKYTSTVYLDPVNTMQNQKQVNSEVKIGGAIIHAQYKRFFFGGEYEESFAFYGGLGIGLNIFNFTETISEKYSKADYRAPSVFEDDKYNEKFIGFSLNGGIGVDIGVAEKNVIHAEIFLNVPANQTNGVEVEVVIPASLNFRVGYRFEL